MSARERLWWVAPGREILQTVCLVAWLVFLVHDVTTKPIVIAMVAAAFGCQSMIASRVLGRALGKRDAIRESGR